MQEQEVLHTDRDLAANEQGGTLLRVKLSDIVAREAWQVRAKTYEDTVKRYYAIYRRDMNTLPPISVADVNGTLLLVDGWHRLEALKRHEREYVPAYVFKATEEEAQWKAASANLKHGLPLKPRELRKVFRAYISAKQHRRRGRGLKSYRAMAADLGNVVSYNTVRNWIRSDYPAIFAQLRDDSADDYAAWANNGPANGVPKVTPLRSAKAHVDAALNEARGMGPKDRQKLISYVIKAAARIEKAKAWNAKEEGLVVEDF